MQNAIEKIVIALYLVESVVARDGLLTCLGGNRCWY